MYASKNYKLLVKALLPPIIYKMVDLPLRTKKIRLKLRNQIKILKKEATATATAATASM